MGNYTGKIAAVTLHGTLESPPNQMHERGNVYLEFQGHDQKYFFKHEDYNIEWAGFVSVLSAVMVSDGHLYVEFNDEAVSKYKQIFKMVWRR